MSRAPKAISTCRACEAEFIGYAVKDEDGMGFVEFPGPSPMRECAVCGADCCRECSRKCAGCCEVICSGCQVETDEGPMCPGCAAEEMRNAAAEERGAAA